MWYLILSVLLLIALAGIPYLVLINSVKKEVHVAPRIPMFLCDIHGVFPAKHTIKITVPAEGMNPLEQEICPFCYSEKMQAAEEIFKQ